MQVGAEQGTTVLLGIFIAVIVFRYHSHIYTCIIRTVSYFSNQRLDVAEAKRDSAGSIVDPRQRNPLTNAENNPSPENAGHGIDHKRIQNQSAKINNILSTKSFTSTTASTSSQPSPFSISKQEQQSADGSVSHSPLPLIQESILEHQGDDIPQYHEDESKQQRRNPSVDSSTHSASQGAANSLSSSTNSEWHVVGHRSSKSTTNSTSQETIYSGTPAHTPFRKRIVKVSRGNRAACA
ncbi:hypothetical protein BDQ17DRAFT_1424456 [Cyathus striatus]|nr:hypothetical protein BDQ17DRAFT_1424456 [Cyathus striatus]